MSATASSRPRLTVKAEAEVRCRPALPGDAAALHQLFGRQFTESYGHRYGPEDIEVFLRSRSLEQWRAELVDPAFAVRIAESGGELIGYVKLGPLALPYDPGDRAALELKQLYVLTAWHGAGVGARLTRWAIGEAARRGAQDLFLAVFPFQDQARRFYARMGFEELHTFSFVLGSVTDDDLICRLRLAEVDSARAAPQAPPP